jgi:hypothetical protein
MDEESWCRRRTLAAVIFDIWAFLPDWRAGAVSTHKSDYLGEDIVKRAKAVLITKIGACDMVKPEKDRSEKDDASESLAKQASRKDTRDI